MKWNSGGGWGFIRPDDCSMLNSGDLFVHNTALVSQGIRFLVKKQRVSFKLGTSTQHHHVGGIMSQPKGSSLRFLLQWWCALPFTSLFYCRDRSAATSLRCVCDRGKWDTSAMRRKRLEPKLGSTKIREYGLPNLHCGYLLLSFF